MIPTKFVLFLMLISVSVSIGGKGGYFIDGACNYNEEVSSFGGGVYNSFISDGKETKKLDLLHWLVQKSPTRNHSLQELRMLLPKED